MEGNKMKKDIRIVILPAGWVFIGEWHPMPNSKEVLLKNAQNIRIWGTTAGLGQLALYGPQSKTELDPSGTVRFDSCIASIECDLSRWGNI